MRQLQKLLGTGWEHPNTVLLKINWKKKLNKNHQNECKVHHDTWKISSRKKVHQGSHDKPSQTTWRPWLLSYVTAIRRYVNFLGTIESHWERLCSFWMWQVVHVRWVVLPEWVTPLGCEEALTCLNNSNSHSPGLWFSTRESPQAVGPRLHISSDWICRSYQT